MPHSIQAQLDHNTPCMLSTLFPALTCIPKLLQEHHAWSLVQNCKQPSITCSPYLAHLLCLVALSACH